MLSLGALRDNFLLKKRSSGKEMGCISHRSLQSRPRSSFLGHHKASSTLLSFSRSSCDYSVGVRGEECGLSTCLGPQLWNDVPACIQICQPSRWFTPLWWLSLPPMLCLGWTGAGIPLSLWALAPKFNFLGCAITQTISWFWENVWFLWMTQICPDA